jgi:hypothetical protein
MPIEQPPNNQFEKPIYICSHKPSSTLSLEQKYITHQPFSCIQQKCAGLKIIRDEIKV